LLPDLGQAIRLKIGQFSAFVEDTREFWRDALREADEEVVDVNDWHVCTVQEREKLGSDYIRYRFKLQGSNCVLPCDIGQEIMLCTVDAEDSVLKEGYICVSPRKARGYFDVVVKRTTEEGTKNKFVRALDLLAIGDEVAYKAGRQRLVYQGDDQEIEALTIVASGAGIAIALHLAQELLPIKDSTVREIEILWLNEKGDDFVLADEMEHLYYKVRKHAMPT
jgi:NAD(P)H-flavin reductase